MNTLGHEISGVLGIIEIIVSTFVLLAEVTVFVLLFTRRGEPIRQFWPWAMLLVAGALVLWSMAVYQAFPGMLGDVVSVAALAVAIVLLTIFLAQTIRARRRGA